MIGETIAHNPAAIKMLFSGMLSDELTIAKMTMALRQLRGEDLCRKEYRALVYWDAEIPPALALRLDMDAVRVELLRRTTMDKAP